MGNIYTPKAPAWLAAFLGIAIFSVPPSSFAQSGKDTLVAMAQAPAPETSSTRGHTGAQSGTGPTVPRSCSEQTTDGAPGQGVTPQGGGKAAPACVDTPDGSEHDGTPDSAGSPDRSGLPRAGGSIDERSH